MRLPPVLHWDCAAPTSKQLSTSTEFFLKLAATPSWNSKDFTDLPKESLPEVAFLGRSNVGKSSLINALCSKSRPVLVSRRPGSTTRLQAISIGNVLGLVDMPGYGYRSREEWGGLVMEYLTKRRTFKRAFLLVNAEHGFKNTDEQIIYDLAHEAIPWQLVLSKFDNVPKGERARVLEGAKLKIQQIGGAAAFGEVIGTSTIKRRSEGISELQYAILRAIGFEGGVTQAKRHSIKGRPKDEENSGFAALSSNPRIPAAA